MAYQSRRAQRIADYFVMVGLQNTDSPMQERECNETLGNTVVPRPTEPITDITVICRSVGEDVPPGYTCVENTLSGYAADLNYGSFRGFSYYLCFRRGTDEPPITDISVYYGGKEKLPSGYQIVKTTAYGRSADLNYKSKPSTFLAFRRAASAGGHNQLAITSIGVVLSSKGESPPHTFHIVKRCLNKSIIGSEVHLCYNKAIVQARSIRYKADVLSRYPLKDHSWFALPDSVVLFCLPMGAVVEYWSDHAVHPLPMFSTFALTQESGDKVYGAAVTFYEQLPSDMWTPYMERVFKKSDPKQAYATKCICLLSHWPFFDTFRWFLRNLYRISVSAQTEIPIERYVTHFMDAVPFPPPDRPQILLQMGHEKHYLQRPVDSPLPLSGASFINFLRCLGPENSLTLLCLALTEQKILLHCRRPALLTSVAEALTSIIFPFEWQCPYIPLCPVKLADVLNAPCPFIVGIDSKYFDLYRPPLELTCVDLDTNTISYGAEKRAITWKILPKKYADVVLKQLRRIHQQLLQSLENQGNLDSLSYAVDIAPLEYDVTIKRKLRSISSNIQHIFLAIQAILLRGYKRFLLPITKSPSSDVYDARSLFDFEGFLKSRSSGAKKFFSQLVKTQLFTRFIEQRSFVSPVDVQFAFFDDYINKVENGISLTELDDHKQKNYTTLVIPSPDTEGLPENKKYEYSSFPALDESLLVLPTKCQDYQLDLMYSPQIRGNLLRSQAEREEAAEIARKQSKSPLLWAKYLLRSCYTIWFMYLPAYVKVQSSPNRALKKGFQVLLQMQTSKLHMQDEFCYRSMMHLCAVYKLPILAIRVLLTMRAVGIHPNAVTYGYYNKAVSENPWPEKTGPKLWSLLRNVVTAIAIFRSFLKINNVDTMQAQGDHASYSDNFYNNDSITRNEYLDNDVMSKTILYKKLYNSLEVLPQSHNSEHFTRPFMASTPSPTANHRIISEQRVPPCNTPVKTPHKSYNINQGNVSSNTSMSSSASSRKQNIFSIRSRRSFDTLSAASSLSSSLNSSLSSISRRLTFKRGKNGFSKSFDTKLESGLLSSFDSKYEFSNFLDGTLVDGTLLEADDEDDEDEDLAVEATISSCAKCHSCSAILYDEEIMAGWTANESNLNTSCRYCCAKFVAFLTVVIKDYRPLYQERHPTTISLPNSDMSGSLDSEERENTFEDGDPVSYDINNLFPPKSAYPSSVLTPVTNAVVLDQYEEPYKELIENDNMTNHGRLHSFNSHSSHKSFSMSDLRKQVNDLDINDKPEETLAYDLMVPNDTSDVKDDGNVKVSGGYSVSMPALYTEHTIREESISVPYLSPIVLQKELESLVDNHGLDIFADPAIIDNHGTVYWNLVWYFSRTGFSKNLPKLLLKRAQAQDIEHYGEALKLRLDVKRVAVLPIWDFEKYDESDGIPLYRQFLSDNNYVDIDDYEGNFYEDHSNCHVDLVQTIVTNLQKNNVFTPITLLLEERIKNPLRMHHRSIYRELLFLACVCSQYIEQDNFDKEFRSGLRGLSPAHMDQLHDYDRVPAPAVTFCRKAFLPLNLPL